MKCKNKHFRPYFLCTENTTAGSLAVPIQKALCAMEGSVSDTHLNDSSTYFKICLTRRGHVLDYACLCHSKSVVSCYFCFDLYVVSFISVRAVRRPHSLSLSKLKSDMDFQLWDLGFWNRMIRRSRFWPKTGECGEAALQNTNLQLHKDILPFPSGLQNLQGNICENPAPDKPFLGCPSAGGTAKTKFYKIYRSLTASSKAQNNAAQQQNNKGSKAPILRALTAREMPPRTYVMP